MYCLSIYIIYKYSKVLPYALKYFADSSEQSKYFGDHSSR